MKHVRIVTPRKFAGMFIAACSLVFVVPAFAQPRVLMVDATRGKAPAKEAVQRLKGMGYPDVEVRKSVKTYGTNIFYYTPDFKNDAFKISESLGLGAQLKERDQLNGGDLVIIVGVEWKLPPEKAGGKSAPVDDTDDDENLESAQPVARDSSGRRRSIQPTPWVIGGGASLIPRGFLTRNEQGEKIDYRQEWNAGPSLYLERWVASWFGVGVSAGSIVWMKVTSEEAGVKDSGSNLGRTFNLEPHLKFLYALPRSFPGYGRRGSRCLFARISGGPAYWRPDRSGEFQAVGYGGAAGAGIMYRTRRWRVSAEGGARWTRVFPGWLNDWVALSPQAVVEFGYHF